ncbi:RidA family protein [Pacificimonas sp. WHA3]|uniref:RidA family protein n=1 Tax=Pacificimonas pallii TaxID=2827236 RepID=A0ABS6SGA0_9SPHN|nr:RidA family protein [Pacificimonas pallii]MBV7257452.1 RidA family protein [Pacificimonas pallii]
MTRRDVIFPAGRADIYKKMGYSAAVRSGDFLFVSGQVGSLEDGSAVADIGEQYRQAFRNLKAVLAAAGCTFDDVVDITSFHVDPEANMHHFAAAKAEVFGAEPYPNWTAVGVTWLGGFQFEIKVIARIPERSRA